MKTIAEHFDNRIHFDPSSGCPVPGIYKNVLFEQYASWKAVSNSSLHAARRSMKHYRNQKPIEESPSMRVGTLCHAGKFEPTTISQRYAVMPAYELGADGEGLKDAKGVVYKNPKASNVYKQLKTAFEETNIGRIIVEQSEYDKVVEMVRSLSEHERASEYLAVVFESLVEVAIIWKDVDTGILCKGRCDVIHQKRKLVSDLKTSNYVENFEKQILDRAYHRQGAFYLDGLKTLTGDDYQFTLTAVENTHPFDVRSAPLNATAISVGRGEYKELLQKIADARQTNEWPGYEDPEEWCLPGWAIPDTMTVEDGVLTSW